MNFAIVRYLIGWLMGIESLFLLLPAFTAVIYREPELPAYIATALICMVGAGILCEYKPKNTKFYAREGFVAVALCWLVLAVTGALPFVLSREIPFAVDAIFEAASGFTTTGATILGDVEALSHASMLWRCLMHWVGGMGILVFMLIVLPLAGGQTIYLMRAESPGPSVSKISPHMRDTALILYAIYFGLTVLQIILLLLGGMPMFDAICVSLGTAGTGGFGNWNDSIAHYDSAYLQNVISVFMILFGINFNAYFLLLTRKFKQLFKIEEIRVYLGVIAVFTTLIAFNVRGCFSSLRESFHHSLFQVASIITTTGFSTVDFNQWPAFSKLLIVLLMFIGACAGSTGGGVKCSRILLLFKGVKKEMMSLIHPRLVRVHKMDGQRVQHEVMRSVNAFLVAYLIVIATSILIVSLHCEDMVTSFTSVVTCINNVGPGLNQVGPAANFGALHPLSKIVLTFDMLAGRLELFPMLLLFAPETWRRNR
ncbi:TrkH family potassium uptake protein [Butyricicoccus sp. AM05-1]|uniref:TrkH family potassium uptake protein n=1 Tax=Butyricicoccus sp. AM05-1 TaxID=2292004 RepID=UPI000E54C5BD|nr:TrkH family potassium uptake protein [Butyricicoccus sp. AM05-1]RHO61535.1 TrkH family potassium uptake protein [Butyricicoccus sp. AM05-1]